MSKKPTTLEATSSEPPEAKGHDIKLQETKKPTNLRANALPTDGYVLSVDGKLKTSYDNAKDAMAAGEKLKQSYPVIQVAVYDARERKYMAVGDAL